MRKPQSFMAGAITLMIAAFIVKVIGALFKIPLTGVLGGEGMGYFMTAYSLFNPVYALGAAGFSVAVSKLVSAACACRRDADSQRVLSTALICFPLIGFLLSVLMYFGAPFFCRVVQNEGAAPAVRAIAPAVFFCCITSVFRGYFEGKRNMIPTSFSQVAEAATKLFAGLFMAYRCVYASVQSFETSGRIDGIEFVTEQEAAIYISAKAATAAVSAVSIAAAVGCIVVIAAYLLERQGKGDASRGFSFFRTASELFCTATPVCAAALAINLSSMVDLTTAMNRMSRAAAANWSALCQSHSGALLELMPPERAINFLFGAYSAMAMTVFNLIPSLICTAAVCALPMIASLAASGQRARMRAEIEAVLRITVLLAVPMGLGISVMARPILEFLFRTNTAEIIIAERLLRPLGVAAVFVSLSAVINSMLQAIGKAYTPVKLLLFGGAIKLLVNFCLISRPEINISGAPWGTLCCYLFITLAGFCELCKYTGCQIGLVQLFKRPVFAALCCCFACIFSYGRLEETNFFLKTPVSVALGALVYFFILLICGELKENYINLLKKGSKFKKET